MGDGKIMKTKIITGAVMGVMVAGCIFLFITIGVVLSEGLAELSQLL